MSHLNAQLLNNLADMFIQNNFDSVAEHFVYPIPYYTVANLQVFVTADTMVKALKIYRERITIAGVTKIKPRIVAEGMQVRGYSHVWVEWDHLNGNGHCFKTNQARYVLGNHDENVGPKIELIEHTVRAFPELTKQLPIVTTGMNLTAAHPN